MVLLTTFSTLAYLSPISNLVKKKKKKNKEKKPKTKKKTRPQFWMKKKRIFLENQNLEKIKKKRVNLDIIIDYAKSEEVGK